MELRPMFSSSGKSTGERARQLAIDLRDRHFRLTDRLFANLLVAEYLAAVAAALWISPYAWAGADRQVHPHVWSAVLLGGVIVSLPIWLVWVHPGTRLTRYVISIAQMLMSGLLIHLSGGRIETHFHVFGSLAFLSFYRDWRVLVIASVVTATDHFIRGYAWPLSIFGVETHSSWRWLEHTSWVIFEDIFLILACRQSNIETNAIAERQVQLEQTNDNLDRTIAERTFELRKSEERFELAVRGSTDGLWDWNILTNEVYYSPRVRELTGYTEVDFPNLFSSFETRMHPDDHDWVMKAVEDHLTERKPHDIKFRLLTGSGEYRWFRVRGQALWDANGIATRMAGSVTDVTVEHQLRERFRLAVEASPSALMMISPEGHILMANSSTQSYFGYTADELIGQPAEMLVPERLRARPENVRRFFEAIVENQGENRQEMIGRRKDGSEFPVKVGLSPVETADGRAVICGVLDITDEKAMVDVMRHAKEAAEAANLAKSLFLANMSHEIRTPLNGVLGMTRLALDTQLNSAQREYLEIARDSADNLLRIIDDVLDFSKIEANKLQLTAECFCVAECVEKTVRNIVVDAERKKLKLSCVLDPAIPTPLIGDAGRLRQVLVNLLSNAVKFTDHGEVALTVQTASVSDDEIWLEFSVRDTGIGIPAHSLKRIFEAFEQMDPSISRAHGGTGLGLSISMKLVSMMGGTLDVESIVGRGSTFHFQARFIPSEKMTWDEPNPSASTSALPPPTVLEKGNQYRILLVEDNIVNQKVACGTLRSLGYHVTIANNGLEALKALDSLSFDVVLMDVQMPEMNGLEATIAIREREKTSGLHQPIIALTAHVSREDREECLRVGMDDFATKPLQTELLHSMIIQHVTNGVRVPTPHSSESAIDQSVFDPEVLLQRVGGNIELRNQIINMMEEELSRLMAELEAGVAEKDVKRIQRAAHTIKGALGNLGAMSAYEASKRVEFMGREGNLERVDEALADLRKLIKSVSIAVAKFKATAN